MTVDDEVTTFPSLFRRIVAEQGDRLAVSTVDETLTYRQLEQRSADMARALLSIGAGKGTRIAALAPGGIQWIVTLCASLRIGAIITSASTLATPSELAYHLRRSDAQILIGVRRFQRHDYAQKLAEALSIDTTQKAGALQLCTSPYLRSIWLDDCAGLTWAQSIEDLAGRAQSGNAPLRNVLTEIEQEVMPSDDCLMVFTSGSTAAPKAVLHSQRTIACKPTMLLASRTVYKNVGPDDRVLALPPTFWMGGIVAAMVGISAGATLVYPLSMKAEDQADAIRKCRVTRVFGGMARGLPEVTRILQEQGFDTGKVAGLVPATSPRKSYGSMGMTETFALHHGVLADGPESPDERTWAGYLIPGFERKVVRPDTEDEVSDGDDGELLLRGGTLMSGYYKTERADTFTRDGFFRTKDRVSIAPDGALHFLGRLSDMIKTTKGANVSPSEVQHALELLPSVEAAFVVGVQDGTLGQIVTAAVVPSSGHRVCEQEIRKQLGETLSGYKIPARIFCVDRSEVPMTATGKPNLVQLETYLSSRM